MTPPPNGDGAWDLISAKVLMRDAGSTDNMVLPLAAGVLARLVLATPATAVDDESAQDGWRVIQDEAHAILALAEDAASRWSDAATFGQVAGFMLGSWPAFDIWLPPGLALHLFEDVSPPFGRAWLQQATTWVQAHPDASLAQHMLVSALGVHGLQTRRNEHPFIAKGARGLRVSLAKLLRDRGLTTWPTILRAAVESWTPAFIEGHALQLSGAVRQMFLIAAETHGATTDVETERVADQQPESAPARDTLPPAPELPPDREALEALKALQDRYDLLRQQVDDLRRERDDLAERRSRSESRAVSVTEELREARQKVADLEFTVAVVRAERDELAEEAAVDASLVPGASTIPADTFAERDVVLFTGQAAADIRTAMEQSFYDLGARHVTCYWTQKTRGPNRVPPETLVVVDITFMSHMDAEAACTMAQRSDAQCFRCRRGASGIAREVATRLRARQSASTAPAPPSPVFSGSR